MRGAGSFPREHDWQAAAGRTEKPESGPLL